MHENTKWQAILIILAAIVGILAAFLIKFPDERQISNPAAPEQVKYEDTTPQQMAFDQNNLPDQKQNDMNLEIKKEDAAFDNGTNLRQDETLPPPPTIIEVIERDE
ncbi:MAG: hypothetical protein FWF00_01125 [Endomicrobia bacterium]|nr:hypothetical protein [Endomicrobiia bacterium]MCL2506276.1 hypothetical protein [Endomicrobiia bacterium]